jgi:hypothetical protein
MLQFLIMHKEVEDHHGGHSMDLEEGDLMDPGGEVLIVVEDPIEDGGGGTRIAAEDGVVVVADGMDLTEIILEMEMGDREVLVMIEIEIEIEIVVDGGKKCVVCTKFGIRTNFVRIYVDLIIHDLLRFTDLFTVNPISTFAASFFYYFNSINSHPFIYTLTHIVNT